MSRTPMWMRTDEEHDAAEKQRADKRKAQIMKWFDGLPEETQDELMRLVSLSAEDSEEGQSALEKLSKLRGETYTYLLQILKWKLSGDLA